MIAAIDMAVTGAGLQRDAPLPAGGLGGRARVGDRIGDLSAGARHGSVARQIRAPILEARFQRLFYQQSAEPRAIDEQLALDRLAAFECDAFHMSVLAMLSDVDDLSFGPPHSCGFGQLTQV